jgi:hypothetical protein
MQKEQTIDRVITEHLISRHLFSHLLAQKIHSFSVSSFQHRNSDTGNPRFYVTSSSVYRLGVAHFSTFETLVVKFQALLQILCLLLIPTYFTFSRPSKKAMFEMVHQGNV